MLMFADISNWNERSYDPGKDRGRIDVVVIKTGGNTKGADFLNPDRAWQLERTRAAGMAAGHYYFATKGRAGWGVAEQVEHFLDNADVRPGDIIQWDWEDAQAGKATPAEVVQAGQLLNTALPRNWVFLYCNGLAWRDTVSAADKKLITAAFPNTAPGGFLWKADYRANPPAEPWGVWQVTSNDPDDPAYPHPHSEPWMSRLVDYNRTKFKTRAEYDAWSLSKDTSPPPEDPVPSTTTRPALSALTKGIKAAFPDVKTIYTQPSGTGGYHPAFSVVKANKPSDYSIAQLPDKPAGDPGFTDLDACAALDIMCAGERLWGICQRLDAAMRARDPRLFVDGKPIVREYFGQLKKGASGKVGYSLFRRDIVTTGDNHTDHAHISIHRWAAMSETALKQLLPLIAGAPSKPDPDPEPLPPVPADATIYGDELDIGATNDSVKWVQVALNAVHLAGESELTVDGNYGPKTTAEVKLFQAQKGVAGNPVDGDLGFKEAQKLVQLSGLAITVKEKRSAPPVVIPPVVIPPGSARPFPTLPALSVTERIPFRGEGKTCYCNAVLLPWVEYALLEAGLLKYDLDIFQLSYSTAVSASAGTHGKGGAADLGSARSAGLGIMRRLGYCGQDRTTAQGFDPHNHGWPNGCPHGSTDLKYQMSQWLRERNGLKSAAKISGPGPIGKATPLWTVALAAYQKEIGYVKPSLAAKVGIMPFSILDSGEALPLLDFELAVQPDDLPMPPDFDDGSNPNRKEN